MLSILLIIFSISFSTFGGIKTISQDENLKNEIKNYLDKTFSQYEGYDYEIVQSPDAKSIKLVNKNVLNLHKNLLYLPVEIKDGTNRTRNSYITIKLKLYQNVFVVNSFLQRNQALIPSDLKIEKIDVSEINGTLVSCSDNISDLQSKIIIKPGTVLINEIVEPKPIIIKGEKVSARVIRGKVMLTVDAFSRQDGAEGEIIKIRTNDNKQFSAKVIDSKNVLIIE